MTDSTYTCAVCHGTYAYVDGWSEADAMAEFIETFGYDPDQYETDNPVCDDCYRMMV